MSLTIYESNTGWPVLQSLTETKHLSGLLSVSAEYIRPVGYGALPTSILTSAGNAAVYPTPTVNKDTSGFEKINATGYGVWDANKYEEVFNIETYSMPVFWSTQRVLISGISGPINRYSSEVSIVIESGWVKKIGESIPLLSRPLGIIGSHQFSVSDFSEFLTLAEGNQSPTSPTLRQSLSMAKKNIFGPVTEIEAAYVIRPYIDFGTFIFSA
jgi:hypothetical protein